MSDINKAPRFLIDAMSKILLHNLTIQYRAYNPDIFHFDENAVFFAAPGDVVVSRRKIADEYLEFLQRVGCFSSDTILISSRENKKNTPVSIFEDDGVFCDVLKIIKQSEGTPWLFDSFVLTEYEARWAEKIGAVYEGDSRHYYTFGGKSAFRSMAKRGHFKVPGGFEYQKNSIDLAFASAVLFLAGFSEIVVKEDEGVAGLGSRRFKRKDFLLHVRDFPVLFSSRGRDAGRGIVPVESDAFIVERWHARTRFSPSIQLHTDSNGAVSVLSVHSQLFYENNMTYRGCCSSQFLPEDLISDVVREGVRFAKIFSEKGYRGHLSFNTIVLENGTVLFTEVNPRRVMSSYPAQIVQRCTSGVDTAPWYISSRIQKNSWKGKGIAHILRELSRNLFSRESQKGIIPYDYGLLDSAGTLSVLCIGSSKEEIQDLMSYATSI